MKTLFATKNSMAPTILRVLLGLVLLAHGTQKLLGWFGGYGFQGTMQYFTGTVGISWLTGFLVIIIEFFGSLFLVAGLGTRIWSLAMLFLFSGIMFNVHSKFGFFMNWAGLQKGEGIEYFLLAIGIAASLAITGGGKYSLDRAIRMPAKGQD